MPDAQVVSCPICGAPLRWALAGTAQGDLVSAKHVVAYCEHCKRPVAATGLGAAQRIGTLDPRQVSPVANARLEPV